MQPLPRLRRPRGALVIAVVAISLALPLGVLASHQFDDVPDSHDFHADIDAIADVGVTQGCDANSYCPNAFVTRGQMAAFLNRLGALQAGKTPVVNADRLDGLHASAFLQAGSVVTSVDGSAWLVHNAAPTSVQRFASNTFVSGDGFMIFPLTAPSEISGVLYGLSTLQVCYPSMDDGGFVTALTIVRTDSTATPAVVFHDGTDRFTAGCFSVDPKLPVGEGLGMFVELAGGVSGGVSLGSVETTWSSTGIPLTSESLDVGSGLLGND